MAKSLETLIVHLNSREIGVNVIPHSSLGPELFQTANSGCLSLKLEDVVFKAFYFKTPILFFLTIGNFEI